MITVEINGKKIEAKEGKSILAVALENGIEIPHFCYHPGLPISGNCRMCLVEIENIPKLQIACATPVREGMKVLTESEKVVRARKGVLEFLLINHPVDCPICDQAGECSLQNYYQKYGLYDSQFIEEKIHKGKVIDLGSGIVLDQERCVLCSRCVRVMRDIAGDEQLGIVNRGGHSEITTTTGNKLDSIYAGNVADTCPVGALTSKDFRFKCRVWHLSTVNSICPGCSTGCNTYIDYNKNRVHRIRPRFNEEVNKYWMCDIGRGLYKTLYSDDRLQNAVLKKGESFEEVSLDDAVAFTVHTLKERVSKDGPASLGIIASSRLSNEDAFIVNEFAQNVIKTKNIDCTWEPDTIPGHDDILLQSDRSPNTRGCKDMGIEAPKKGNTVKKMLKLAAEGKIKTVVIVDNDLYINEKMASDIEKALSTAETVIVFATHRSKVCDFADLVVPISLWAEREGTFTNRMGIVQKFQAAVTPPEGVTPLFSVIGEICQVMGSEIPSDTAAQVFDRIRKSVKKYSTLKLY